MGNTIQDEIEFSRMYKKDPKAAITAMYSKLLSVEQKVDDLKKIAIAITLLVLTPIIGIITGAFFNLVLKK